jgi:hypothetical protein
MAPRPSRKKSTGSSHPSDNNFHLIGKKTAMGTSGAVVGAIVAGPVGAVLGGVLGTAFGAAADVHPSKSKRPSKSIKPATKKAGSRLKAPRKRRVSRITTKS